MFQHDAHAHPMVFYRRPTGRLMRPSDRMIPIHGLGEVDGFMDTLKNLGTGIVRTATFGIYDPAKGRFYVPFSSGNVRNFLTGSVSVTTMGLVKSDKFFNTKAAKTAGTVIGAVGAVVGAGALAYYGGGALMKQFGSTAPGVPGSPTFGPPTPTVQQIGSTTKSFLPSLDTVTKTLDITQRLAPIAMRGGGGLPPPMGGGQPSVVVINQPSGELPMGTSYVPNQAYGYGYDPSMNYSGLMPPGGGVMYSGGGGGIGPPGSEYAGEQPMVMNEQGVLEPAGMPMATKVALVAGVGIVGYLLFAK